MADVMKPGRSLGWALLGGVVLLLEQNRLPVLVQGCLQVAPHFRFRFRFLTFPLLEMLELFEPLELLEPLGLQMMLLLSASRTSMGGGEERSTEW